MQNCLGLLHAVCAAGYAGASCTACPVGSWADEAAQGTQNCTQCGSGLTTPAIASTSADNCTRKDGSQAWPVLHMFESLTNSTPTTTTQNSVVIWWMVQPQCAAVSTTAGPLHLKDGKALCSPQLLVIYLKYAVVAYAEQALSLTGALLSMQLWLSCRVLAGICWS